MTRPRPHPHHCHSQIGLASSLVQNFGNGLLRMPEMTNTTLIITFPRVPSQNTDSHCMKTTLPAQPTNLRQFTDNLSHTCTHTLYTLFLLILRTYICGSNIKELHFTRFLGKAKICLRWSLDAPIMGNMKHIPATIICIHCFTGQSSCLKY